MIEDQQIAGTVVIQNRTIGLVDYQGIHITEDRMTKEEVNDYWAGFDENESSGCHKEW